MHPRYPNPAVSIHTSPCLLELFPPIHLVGLRVHGQCCNLALVPHYYFNPLLAPYLLPTKPPRGLEHTTYYQSRDSRFRTEMRNISTKCNFQFHHCIYFQKQYRTIITFCQEYETKWHGGPDCSIEFCHTVGLHRDRP